MTALVEQILAIEAKIKQQEDGLLKHWSWNETSAHAYNLNKLTEQVCALEEQLTASEMFELCVAKGIYNESTIWTDIVGEYKVDTRFTFDGVWETMVFKGSKTVDEAQYLDIEKAFEGHFDIIKKWK